MSKMMKVSIQYFLLWLNCSVWIYMVSLNITKKSIVSASSIKRIVNGQRCSIEDHPYMVSIRVTKYFEHSCGGTILSELWILTAGHCGKIYYTPGYFTVVYGLSIITKNNTSDQNSALVISNYVHHNPLEHDICLMQIDKPIQQRKNVHFVQLANYLHKNMDIRTICKNAMTMGWGVQNARDKHGAIIDDYPTTYDPHLQCVELPISDRKECDDMYGYHLPDSVICTFADHKDACQGDSGGPLMCNDVQYGISSFSIGCAFGGYPGTFTRVDVYEEFIRNIILTGKDKNRGSLNLLKGSYFLLIELYIVLSF